MEDQRIIKQLTVGELKKLIDHLPDDLRVETEGCDCVGPSDGVSVDTNAGTITINRNDRIDRETHEYDPKDWE